MTQARLERATLVCTLAFSAIVTWCGSLQAQSTNASNASAAAFATSAPIEQKLIVEDQVLLHGQAIQPAGARVADDT